MNLELKDKIAIVTGGARGIGKSISKILHREGASIVVVGRNFEAAEKYAAELGPDCMAVGADISNTEDQDRIVVKTMDRYGRIDILVNNAGITNNIDFLEITKEEFDHYLQVNLDGMVFLTQKVMQQMVKQNYGRIVNMASMAGERGGVYAGIHYSTSKAGVIVATKCMALKGAKYNITANAIAPGLVATEMAEKLAFGTDDIPLGRLATTDEIAEGVAFLASDRASYITGTTLDINGGQFLH